MVAILETCIECGEKFLRGVWPVSRCDRCSMRDTRSYRLRDRWQRAAVKGDE